MARKGVESSHYDYVYTYGSAQNTGNTHVATCHRERQAVSTFVAAVCNSTHSKEKLHQRVGRQKDAKISITDMESTAWPCVGHIPGSSGTYDSTNLNHALPSTLLTYASWECVVCILHAAISVEVNLSTTCALL